MIEELGTPQRFLQFTVSYRKAGKASSKVSDLVAVTSQGPQTDQEMVPFSFPVRAGVCLLRETTDKFAPLSVGLKGESL